MTQLKRDIFVTTRWTMVLRAARSDTTRARAALEDLCQAYWYPLYAYARRRGYSPHDAEDLTQGFFARILKLNSLADVGKEQGKFRAFLLASMNHFISDEWDRASAQKRGAQRTISLDAEMAENRYRSEPADKLTPEYLFERRWAMTLLENVVQRLRGEYEASGQGPLFMEMRFAITGDKNAVPYTDLAARLSLSEEALRVAVHRLRQRYRRALREEIAQTVADESEVTEELNCLRRILSA
jgi:RNA polymerase sigma-70 factor (ECF subfamily)